MAYRIYLGWHIHGFFKQEAQVRHQRWRYSTLAYVGVQGENRHDEIVDKQSADQGFVMGTRQKLQLFVDFVCRTV